MFEWFHRKNKPKSLGFKETSQAFDKEFKAISKIKDEGDRLAEYKELLEDIDSVFKEADDDIMRAAEPADAKKDGIAAYSMSPTFLTMGLLGGILLPPLYSIAPLAPFFPILAPASFVLAGGTVWGARHMLFRSRAKELGMAVTDVKYAQKIRKQQTKVQREIKALTEFETQQAEREKLEALRQKFAAKAEQKKIQAGNKPAPAAPVVAPAPQAPAPTPVPPAVEAQAQTEAPVKAAVHTTVPKMARAPSRAPKP